MRTASRRSYILNLSRHRIGWLVVLLAGLLIFLFLLALLTARTAASVL